jgi:hypothetical protein
MCFLIALNFPNGILEKFPARVLSLSLVATAKSERITKAHIAQHQIAVSLGALTLLRSPKENMNASGPSASEFCVYIDDIAVCADCRWTKISFNLTRGLALSDKPFNKRLCCIKAAACRSRVLLF